MPTVHPVHAAPLALGLGSLGSLVYVARARRKSACFGRSAVARHATVAQWNKRVCPSRLG